MMTSDQTAPLRLVVFGLPYSPNLGDGVIAECLRAGILDAAPDCVVQCVDISGRQGFGELPVRNRTLALAILRLLPRPVAQRLVQFRLGRLLDGFEPGWRQAAANADLAIIGGGQIFSDADLNFCLKIERVSRILRETGCPVVVHGAGVARNWSPRGRELFRRLLECDLRAVGLRDEPSMANWVDQIGPDGPEPVLTRDPALIAAQVYHPAAVTKASPIGLCVTDPALLSYHAEGGRPAIGDVQVFAEIALRMAERGHSVRLFCNGAVEDRAALAELESQPAISMAIADGRIDIAPCPEMPAQLAAIIAGCRAVIAHRLHACILGHAFGRPIVGLGWDRKLESFFASVGLEDCFLAADDFSPERAARLAETALQSGIDPDYHSTATAEARAAIHGILTAANPPALRADGHPR